MIQQNIEAGPATTDERYAANNQPLPMIDEMPKKVADSNP